MDLLKYVTCVFMFVILFLLFLSSLLLAKLVQVRQWELEDKYNKNKELEC